MPQRRQNHHARRFHAIFPGRIRPGRIIRECTVTVQRRAARRVDHTRLDHRHGDHVVFTAANVFFGLKAGLTFATSIPAAVISMAVLRYFKNSTIQENNIVQTVASAAGTLSSIIFVLPGLVMIGWWTGFNY
jgi:hypothetical protein